MLRSALVVLALGATWVATAETGPATRAISERSAPATTPDRLIREHIDALTAFLDDAGQADPVEIRAFLDASIAPLFDFEYMARWAAGPLLRRLDDDQRARLAVRLQTLFLDALARNLGSYARTLPRVHVYPPRRHGRTVTVIAQVAGDLGVKARLEFRFYRSASRWRIYDVVANGASAVAYYRGSFGEQLRRHGPESLLQ